MLCIVIMAILSEQLGYFRATIPSQQLQHGTGRLIVLAQTPALSDMPMSTIGVE
jgi:hypothetical protein